MAKDHTHDHPDYGKIRMGAAFAAGEFEEADELDEAGNPTDAEIASNELHAAAGQVCGHCGQPIAPGADVRKTVKGGYVHETCPLRSAPG